MKRILFTFAMIFCSLSVFSQIKNTGGEYYIYKIFTIVNINDPNKYSFAFVLERENQDWNKDYLPVRENGKIITFSNNSLAITYLSSKGWEILEKKVGGETHCRRKATKVEIETYLKDKKRLVDDSYFNESLKCSEGTFKVGFPHLYREVYKKDIMW